VGRIVSLGQKRLLLVAALGVVNATHAIAETPSAGSLLQQLDIVPQPLRKSTNTELPRSAAPQVSGQPEQRFAVKELRLVGNKLLTSEQIFTALKLAKLSEVTLDQLEQYCYQIGNIYLANGYPMVRAIVPQQDVTDGIITLQIAEASLGDAQVVNNTALSSQLLEDTLETTGEGQPIRQQALERALLLLGDIPGVKTRAVFKPGSIDGTADLQVTTREDKKLFGSVGLSNYGGESLNRERFSGNLNINNPFNDPGVLSGYLITSGQPFNYFKLDYQTTLNKHGLRGGIGTSALNYKLSGQLSGADIRGDARSLESNLSYPLIRSQQQNLYSTLKLQLNNINDISGNSRQDRSISTLELGLSGNFQLPQDSGRSYWQLGLHTGRVAFKNDQAENLDSQTGNTRGNFEKLVFDASHSRPLSQSSALRFSFSAQAATENLDASEKLVLGGPNSIRAYDIGAVSGDSGYKLNLEYQQLLGNTSYGSFQGSLFADVGHVKINDKPWSSGINGISLKGAGVAVDWFGPNNWRARASAAGVVGKKPTSVENIDTSVLWFEVNKAF